MTAPAAVGLYLDVRRLSVHFIRSASVPFAAPIRVRAVDDVSFQIRRGETLGLVGESGSGKSTIGRALIGLRKRTSGAIEFDGHDIASVRGGDRLRLRRRMQIVFQDPYSSLNPSMSVGRIVADPIAVHRLRSPAQMGRRVDELLNMVGLEPGVALRYPRELSGGQQQRVSIARSLAVEPEFLVCDEPVSALDVSVQAQILNLLTDLSATLDLTYLFIAHDLAAVRHISHRVAVMYLGRIVEIGAREDVYRGPAHPYTIGLMSASPIPDPEKERARRRIPVVGEIPSPENAPSGCRFHPRCWLWQRLGQPERCATEDPILRTLKDRHDVACHYPEEAMAEATAPVVAPLQGTGA